MVPNLLWLEDPTVFQVNRLDAHSDHICYPSLEELQNCTTSLRQNLDGQWHFAWSKAPALPLTPVNFMTVFVLWLKRSEQTEQLRYFTVLGAEKPVIACLQQTIGRTRV